MNEPSNKDPAGLGISSGKVKKSVSERRKVQMQHFEEQRKKLKEEYDGLEGVKGSFEEIYCQMIQEREKLMKMRGNLLKMLADKTKGEGPVPEGMFQYSSAFDSSESEDGSEEERNEAEVFDVSDD